MSRLSLLLIALAAVAVGQPQYCSTTFPRQGTTNWYPTNGTLVESAGYLGSPSLASRGSVVSSFAPPTGNDYEVRTTYRITASGGSLVTLLRANPQA